MNGHTGSSPEDRPRSATAGPAEGAGECWAAPVGEEVAAAVGEGVATPAGVEDETPATPGVAVASRPQPASPSATAASAAIDQVLAAMPRRVLMGSSPDERRARPALPACACPLC